MKTYKEFLYENKNYLEFPIPETAHYDKFNDAFRGKTRFYISGGHGYFTRGAKVNVPDVYDKVTRGTVSHIGRYHSTDNLLYRIKLELPLKHPDAVDEDGEYTKGSNIKHLLMSDKELVKYNPESEWDGR